ncbi:MAG TPA: hypothetical protein VJC05_04525 [Candidatus Andersenbacteria bacterium]|nr:hypothetical protein [Candidatus Andersenbacteria bacterium]
MNDKKIIIESLAMDLKRVAVGLHRGSTAMAHRFKQEALQRQQELEELELNDYLKKIVADSKKAIQSKQPEAYEDVLMYSTLFQNFARKNLV